MDVSRRGLLTGLASLLAAPAIVRVTSLMPVKALGPPELVLPYTYGENETFSQLVTQTMRRHRSLVIANITENNALLSMLKERNRLT